MRKPRVSRSIRWALLTWYALILTAALATFAVVLHDEMERAMYRGADEQIALWLRSLEHDAMGSSLPNNARFAVWDVGGVLIASSELDRDRKHPRAVGTTMRDDLRARTIIATEGGSIWAAKDVSEEHARVRRFLRVLMISGAGILALALGGGWFLVTRALKPITEITAAAERISSDTLSERIDEEAIQNELGGLAKTLNKTFARLEESFERQTRFTADASHELRTPLTILLSHLELGQRKDRRLEEFQERVQVCLAAARRMRAVVEGLLTLARIDAGEVELEREPVDLLNLAREVAASLAPLAREQDVEIEVRGTTAATLGDQERLRLAVTNLVTNAIRYNKESGRVTITAARSSEHATLRVQDTGVGIPEEDLPHIFERFYRVDRARSRERGGTGLGLAITKWIAEIHAGDLEVESRVGSGSQFTLRIP